MHTPPLTFSNKVAGLGLSSTLAINEQSKALAVANVDVTRLGLGQSPFPVPPPVIAALKKNAHQKDYLPVAGLPELRGAIAAHLNQTRGMSFSADNILVGPGSKELLFLLQLVCESTLMLPTPSWVSYAPQAQLAGVPVVWVPTSQENGWQLQAEALELTCVHNPAQQRLLILNYPNNPAGTSYTDTDLAKIAAVARKHNIIIVADEIYWELSFAEKPGSMVRHYPEGTIISTGLSKWCGAGGWRLGAFAIPDRLAKLRGVMMSVASETFSAVSAPIQYAAIRAFEGGHDIATYLHHSRRIMATILEYVAQALRAYGVHCISAQGGFYLLPDFSEFKQALAANGIYSGKDLASRLLHDTGIACLPGSEFGLPDSDLVLRAALVDFDGAAALRACEKEYKDKALSEEFLKQYTPKIHSAPLKITNWLSGVVGRDVG